MQKYLFLIHFSYTVPRHPARCAFHHPQYCATPCYLRKNMLGGSPVLALYLHKKLRLYKGQANYQCQPSARKRRQSHTSCKCRCWFSDTHHTVPSTPTLKYDMPSHWHWSGCPVGHLPQSRLYLLWQHLQWFL